ncbi:Small nuclear ribonucleoprotein E [Geodia barretti]|uniref:Small nuclear ribonucleoprotein E n=1 Tax=Geodia barretti TaxID=519541 RepID=A0AA35WRI0_GEOBA|nr:Small nuclear ribonucleoprotein E [Geodia barretti]
MAYRPQKVQKVMVQPINLIFRYLQNKARVQVWLFGRGTMRIEGIIIGFDEFMNLVMDDAVEVYMKKDFRRQIGRSDPAKRRQYNTDHAGWTPIMTNSPCLLMLGYGDLSTYGHPTSFTPNIQNMADNGLILTNFYSNSPVCSPSRSHDIM